MTFRTRWTTETMVFLRHVDGMERGLNACVVTPLPKRKKINPLNRFTFSEHGDQDIRVKHTPSPAE